MTKFTLIVLACITVFASCTKIDSTTVGQGLIPPVDGVTTLLTDTFSINCENGIFSDTSKLFASDDNVLGNLQNNTQFGSTNASVFVQMHPTSGFNWRAPTDSIKQINNVNTTQGFDSAFLCLGINASAIDNGIFGDSTQDITFEVFRINNTATFNSDSTYKVATSPTLPDDNIAIGSITIKPKDLRKYNYYYLKQTKDSAANQLRIKLNAQGQSWVRNNWLYKDTSSNITTGTFNSLSSFTGLNKGFVIKAKNNGNALLKITLANNAASRFEVWYKYRNNGITDTANQFFYYNATAGDPWKSANANYINRSTGGSTMITSTAAGNDNLVYIESTPGSYTKITIPFIKNFPNKLIHRAELIMVEDAAYKNNNFYAPTRLMLDCFDSSLVSPQKFISTPYDYYYSSSQVDFSYYGGDRKLVTDPISGKELANYNFNITKYFQNIITRGTQAYKFRLYAPFDTRFYSQALGYYSNLGSSFTNTIWPLVNPTAMGRVVIGNGANPNYKMKLRIIYSNI